MATHVIAMRIPKRMFTVDLSTSFEVEGREVDGQKAAPHVKVLLLVVFDMPPVKN